ncbi:HAD family hydrolase [Aureivirga sp. CE67]|uniref:HAD family hydrolase n=1 Tax=Aureivirga sp. CE67 TaxID=1788983 RepID=UPI0018C99E9C|nr:HAD hydrolase-like protein [Aureivirga sp. CE67]
MIKNKKIIIWDFDGVIMFSNEVRDNGFVDVLKDFPKDQVDALLDFHQANGGLSRYVKFRYFFEEIRNESITEEEVNNWAKRFSEVMLQNLIKEELLNKEVVDFIKNNHEKITMYIASGSDQKELNHICESLNINRYFEKIYGSPIAKIENVVTILKANTDIENSYFALIGDSINDYEAATANEISFYGYNNKNLEELGNYINSFE